LRTLVRRRTEFDGGPLARSHLFRPVCIHLPNHLYAYICRTTSSPKYMQPKKASATDQPIF